jgi:inner membrane protein
MLSAAHFLTHVGLSWVLANLGGCSRKDRCLVVLAGVLPDLDGIGMVWGEHANLTMHRVVGHNLLAGLLLTGILMLRADSRWLTGALAALSFHLHLLLDVVGTGGLPVQYLWPFSHRGLTYRDHWVLTSWQNVVVMLLTLAGVLTIAWRQGRTPIECLSPSADRRLLRGARRRAPAID